MDSSADKESAIRDQADAFARSHAKAIVAEFLQGYEAEDSPVSTFMAGSPGAGKTETSKRLLQNAGNTVRIDADDLREHFRDCGYDGANSHLFQKASSKLVHEIHSAALKREISFLMDGTFANENMARQNIQRSLKRGRDVFIIFVYQSPQTAWNFVLQREVVEGRRVRAEDFAEKFCASQAVVNRMKAEFGRRITLELIIKELDQSDRSCQRSIERIEDHIPERYSAQEILALIANPPVAADE